MIMPMVYIYKYKVMNAPDCNCSNLEIEQRTNAWTTEERKGCDLDEVDG
jgi:hypothetical protein